MFKILTEKNPTPEYYDVTLNMKKDANCLMYARAKMTLFFQVFQNCSSLHSK